MFFVYGVGGRVFRGSPEQLRQIGGVNAIARARAIPATGHEGHDPQSGPSEPVFSVDPLSVPVDGAHRSALAAYADAKKVEHQPQPLRRVAELMSTSVITVADSIKLLDAWHKLAENGVGQAPVINSAGILVGLLSRADLMRPERLPTPQSHAEVWQALLAEPVSALMTTPVPSVGANTDIRRVASVLLDGGLPGLPVVDDEGVVLGFISRSDILRAVVTSPPLDLWG